MARTLERLDTDLDGVEAALSDLSGKVENVDLAREALQILLAVVSDIVDSNPGLTLSDGTEDGLARVDELVHLML